MSTSEEQTSSTEPLCIFGPRKGFSPQIGMFVSQLNWMRRVVVSRLQDLSVSDLDWRPEPTANSIGSLLLHLAATEVYYGANTFDGLPWGECSPEVRKLWGPAMKLGDLGRSRIKGHSLQFYLSALEETRANTLAQLRQRDDKWFMAVDQSWGWGPTNNFCKWFHVCEHESHHNGQIDLLLKHLPSRMATGSIS